MGRDINDEEMKEKGHKGPRESQIMAAVTQFCG